jgi:hypothetical protein
MGPPESVTVSIIIDNNNNDAQRCCLTPVPSTLRILWSIMRKLMRRRKRDWVPGFTSKDKVLSSSSSPRQADSHT